MLYLAMTFHLWDLSAIAILMQQAFYHNLHVEMRLIACWT